MKGVDMIVGRYINSAPEATDYYSTRDDTPG
jgi:hypothetical protein